MDIRFVPHLWFLFLLFLQLVLSGVDAFASVETAAQSRQALINLGDETTCMNTCRTCNVLGPTVKSAAALAPRSNSASSFKGYDANKFVASTGVGVHRKFFFLHIPNTGGSVVERGIKAAACQPHSLGLSAHSLTALRGVPGRVKWGHDVCFCGRNGTQFESLANRAYRQTSPLSQPGRGQSIPNISGGSLMGVEDFAIFCGRRPWGMVPGFVEAHAPVTAVLLRDPLTQAASHWDQTLKRRGNHTSSFEAAIRYSTSTFGKQERLEHKRGALFRNEQVFWMCGLDCRPSMPLSDALALAKRNLKRTAAIGTADHLIDLFEQLHAILPWWPSKNVMKAFDSILSSNNGSSEVISGGKGGSISGSKTAPGPLTSKLAAVHKNVHQLSNYHTSIVADTPTEALELLKEFLWADIELYNFAQELAQEKSIYVSHCRALARETNCTGFVSDCH